MFPVQGMNRKHRSEQDQEVLQALWYQLVKKLLTVKKGPFNLAITGRGVIEPREKICSHPPEQQTKGANQYGTWTKCLRCGEKTSYKPYGPENPKPTSKKSGALPAVAPKSAAVARSMARHVMAAPASSADTPITRAELQQTLSVHTRELANTLSETLMPLMQSQAQLQNQVGFAMMALGQQNQGQYPIPPQAQGQVPQGPEWEITDDEMSNPNQQGWEQLP